MDDQAAAAFLGISLEATKQEITRAFRARAKVLHPDISGSDEAFVALRAAFELLHGQAPEHRPAQRPAMTWRQAGRAPASIIDLTGSQIRAAAPRRQARSTTGAPGQPRDASGMTFADHLVAELQRHPT